MMTDLQVAVAAAAVHLRMAPWFAVPQIAWPPEMCSLIDTMVVCALAGEQPE